uniref:Arginine--tRNA ligase n=1 Tax=candidate division WOR-3 bacterium TaxID=2052148 RepID=A0A7C2NZC8_UNCW3
MRKLLRERIEEKLKEIIEKNFGLKADFYLEESAEENFGDYSTNILFKLAKELKKNPAELGEKIVEQLSDFDLLEKVEVQKGFLNFKISQKFLWELLINIAEDPANYGKNNLGNRLRVNLEFVSANPTGPLVVVNARAAAVGDSLKRIMNTCGYIVDSEYYVNDAGGQIERLRKSIEARIFEIQGLPFEFPEDGYQGEYIYDIAKEILKRNFSGDYGRFAVEYIHHWQKNTLERYRVKFDRFIFETEIRNSEYPRKVMKILEESGLVYAENGATVFKSSIFGDDKDRVLIRSNGEPTYFFFDLAYHLHKIERNYDILIDIWGPDHHGYILRMQAGLKALGFNIENFKVLIAQQVNLVRGKEKVKMSKRKGEIYSMDDLIDEVGVDAARFFFLTRTVNAHLDFDLELAKTIGVQNPVYYVQYSHARIASLLDFGREKGLSYQKGNPSLLTDPEERSLIRKIMFYPDVLQSVCRSLEPHLLVRYLLELSELYHSYYQKVRIVTEDAELSNARLLLSFGVKTVVKNGLELLGIEAPERM